MAVMDWVKAQRRVYFGNASSVRDYRAQLRGFRAALFWAIYLGLLIVCVTIAYADIVSKGEQSVTHAQSDLKSFYSSVLVMLEIMVALVAPVIVALSIQAEIQRKSYDLVITSPVSPKYFLVGKVLSGYRYVVMLLFLSLPIAAAAVVLGGATWSEVLVSYVLVAAHGLFYIGVSLPIAVLSAKVAPTVVYSYMACWFWAITGAGSLGAMAFSGSAMRGMSAKEVPYVYLLYPFGFAIGVDTHSTVFGVQVPNWILAVLTLLAIVKLFIVGAGSAMTRLGSKETVSLRIHGLIIASALTLAMSWGTFGGGVPGMGGNPAQVLAVFLSVLCVPFMFVIVHLSTWSYIDERKHRPNGFFSVRRAFTAAPEGGLPYLLLLLATVTASGAAAWSLSGGDLSGSLAIYLFWLAGAWVFFWSMGWLLSSFTSTGIGTARKSHIALTILVSLLPWPVLSIVKSLTNVDVFSAYPFVALQYGEAQIDMVLFMGAEFWVAAAFLAFWGEYRRRFVVSSKWKGLAHG